MILKALRSRGARKFRQNRLAMFALGVISVYGVVALLVALGGIRLEETFERVSRNSIPGAWGSQTSEKRVNDAEEYLEEIESALDNEEHLEYRFAERKLVDLPVEELVERVEESWEIWDELADVSNVDEHPELLVKLDEVEERIDALFAPLEGVDGWMYAFRTYLGTDRQGRSITVRAVYSIKLAIQVGFIVALAATLLGTLLGAAAGFFGGWIDGLVIWLYSTFSAIPVLIMLMVLVTIFIDTPYEGTLVPLYVSMMLTFWIGPCRVIRGEVLKLKELEYVQAATSIGFGRFYILVKHLIPNTSHLMFINFSLLFIGAIKNEVILTFLNLGVKNQPSWGTMINQSRQEVINGFFWQIGAATALMFGLVWAFNIVSDALQDSFDPKHVS